MNRQWFMKIMSPNKDILHRPSGCRSGCYQGWQELSDYQLFGSFTVTIEDAEEYLYSFSKTRRVHRFQSFKVNLYI